MKRYRIKNLKIEPNFKGINDLKIVKKFVKNDVEKCKVEDIQGYEYIIIFGNLEQIKTKSKKNK
tara:strand:+ start:20 stop:211 length:192 start_codon:yes stop_codon:yes gene_type:complete